MNIPRKLTTEEMAEKRKRFDAIKAGSPSRFINGERKTLDPNPVEPESKSVAKKQNQTCVHLGEKIGKLDCGCGGKPFVFECHEPQNEPGICTLHAYRPRTKDIKLTDGGIRKYNEHLLSCGLCTFYTAKEGETAPEPVQEDMFAQRLKSFIDRRQKVIDGIIKRAARLEAGAAELRDDANNASAKLQEDIIQFVESRPK